MEGKIMFYLLLIFMAVVLVVAGYGHVVYCAAGILAIKLLWSLLSQRTRISSSSERLRPRIEHPHYLSENEYECGICGKRFSLPLAVCPYCGVRFNCKDTDDREYDDELDEELDMDEWDEEE